MTIAVVLYHLVKCGWIQLEDIHGVECREFICSAYRAEFMVSVHVCKLLHSAGQMPDGLMVGRVLGHRCIHCPAPNHHWATVILSFVHCGLCFETRESSVYRERFHIYNLVCMWNLSLNYHRAKHLQDHSIFCAKNNRRATERLANCYAKSLILKSNLLLISCIKLARSL